MEVNIGGQKKFLIPTHGSRLSLDIAYSSPSAFQLDNELREGAPSK